MTENDLKRINNLYQLLIKQHKTKHAASLKKLIKAYTKEDK